jgi:hypothetical protein
MTGFALAGVVVLGAIAIWQTFVAHDLRERRAIADACIETQRIAVEALVIKLQERKAKSAALLIAITAAHDAAQRGDTEALIVALRAAVAVTAVAGDA